jgi:hypothetical protein
VEVVRQETGLGPPMYAGIFWPNFRMIINHHAILRLLFACDKETSLF